MQQQVCRNNLLFGPPLRPLQDIQSIIAHRRSPQLLSVNCLFSKDDPMNAFTVKIPKIENVSLLKSEIKKDNARRLAHLAASDLTLYKVSLNIISIDSKAVISGSEGNSDATRIRLHPLQSLKEVFPKPLPSRHVHIIIEDDPGTCPVVARFPPLTWLSEGLLEEFTPNSLTRFCTLQQNQIGAARKQFCALRLTAFPSAEAEPEVFKRGQQKAIINCNRPYDTAKTLPLRLSHPVFGQFMDDCKSFKPTTEDKAFIYKFVEAMSKIYDMEKDRQTAILDLFGTAGIDMQPNRIVGTDYMTDGSSLVAGRLLYVLAELKNEIGSTASEPYLQAVLQFLESTKEYASEYLDSGLPCMILLIFGMFAWTYISCTHTNCAYRALHGFRRGNMDRETKCSDVVYGNSVSLP